MLRAGRYAFRWTLGDVWALRKGRPLHKRLSEKRSSAPPLSLSSASLNGPVDLVQVTLIAIDWLKLKVDTRSGDVSFFFCHVIYISLFLRSILVLLDHFQVSSFKGFTTHEKCCNN